MKRIFLPIMMLLLMTTLIHTTQAYPNKGFSNFDQTDQADSDSIIYPLRAPNTLWNSNFLLDPLRAPITVDGPGTLCLNEVGRYSSNTTFSTYIWKKDGVVIPGATTKEIDVSWDTPGPHTISVQDADPPSGTVIPANVTVIGIPAINEAPIDPQEGCNNTPTTAIPLTSNVPGTIFVYSGAADIGLPNNSSSSGIPSFTPNISGSATIQRIITVIPRFIKPNGTYCDGTPVTFTFTIIPKPVITDPIPAQNVCSGDEVDPIPLTPIPNITYTWTGGSDIGLPDGDGTSPDQIDGFTAVTTTSVIWRNVTVTPIYTSDLGTICPGTSKTFRITVYPKPNITGSPDDRDECKGVPVYINLTTLSGYTPGVSFYWTGGADVGLNDNTTPSTSISFTTKNEGNTFLQRTITLLPIYKTPTGECEGDPITFEIIVNPKPDITTPLPNIVKCNGEDIGPILLGGNVGGTIFYWTGGSDIGLTDGDSPNEIPLFPATITGTTAITAIITVTPKYPKADGSGDCSGDQKTFTIKVLPKPEITTTLEDLELCAGIPQMSIPLTSTIPGTTFYWTGGVSVGLNNGNSTSGLPQFTPINSGTTPNSATVTVWPVYKSGTDECTGDEITFEIIVNPKPDITTPLPNIVKCNGEDIGPILLGGNVGGTIFYWTGGSDIGLTDGDSPNEIPLFPATITGTTAITAIITVTPKYPKADGSGDCSGDQKTFTIKVLPKPEITTTLEDLELCAGIPQMAIPLTSTIPGTTFYWTGGVSVGLNNGNSTSGLPQFTPINSGTTPNSATVTVWPVYKSGTDECTGDEITFEIIVNPKPDITTPLPNIVKCNGEDIGPILLGGNVGGTIFYWTGGSDIGLTDGDSPNEIPLFPATITGTTAITAIITVTPKYPKADGSGDCSGDQKTFTIKVLPKPEITTTLEDLELCAGIPQMAIPLTSTIPGTTFYWTGGVSVGLNNGNSTSGLPQFTPINSGTIPNSATVTVWPVYKSGTDECTGDEITFEITVNPKPTITTNLPPVVACNGDPIEIDLDTDVPGTIFQWTGGTDVGLNDGVGNQISFLADIGGSTTAIPVTITVTPKYPKADGDSCSGNIKTFTIKVLPKPEITTVLEPLELCAGVLQNAMPLESTIPGTIFYWTGGVSVGLNNGNSINGFPQFTPINSGTTPNSATVTVWPVYKSGTDECTGDEITFEITVNPKPTITKPADIVVCDSTEVGPINLSGSVPGTVFYWSGGASINLPNNFTTTGTIDPFIAHIAPTATNPITAIIKVVAKYPKDDGGECTGDSTTFTITVLPKPRITGGIPGALFFCNGDNHTFSPFTTNIPNNDGVKFYWSGGDNIHLYNGSSTTGLPNFTAFNGGNGEITVDIIVIPVFEYPGHPGCEGTSITFPITVNPTPTVNRPTDKVFCAGENTDDIIFTGNVAGTEFSWTNSNTAIGLGPNGNGNILSFLATNSGTGPISGIITVTPTYTNGNPCEGDTVKFTITVNPQPTASLSGPSTISCICSGSAVTLPITLTGIAPWTVVYNDGTDHTINITAAQAPGGVYQLVVNPTTNTTYTLVSVTDATTCQGTVSGSVSVEVDTEAPVITVPTTPLVQTCFDAAEVDAWMATATVTDNCDATVTVSGSYTPPTGNCNQTVTVTFTATDVCGNTATETATFTVNDNIAPVITVPTTPLVQTCFDAAEVDAWMATATVTDNCDATVTVSGSYTPPTGNCNQTVTVTFTATDVCGNTATETATFTVNDNIAPVITVPTTPLVQTCFDAAEVDAWMATATVTDNCDATVTVSGSYTPPTGNCNQTVTVTFTATDVCGNTATETATFTVNDNIAPVITVPTTPLVQTCFDAAEVDAWMATATVTDNCDATVTVSGSYTPPTGNCNQTVTVTFTATDVCGNTATETATFTVNDNIAPVITVPTTPLVQTCFDAAEVDAWMATATVTDNCDATVTVSGSYTPPTGNCNQTVTVTFSATDVCGNTATETATFTVNDNIAPVITVPTTPLVQTCFDAAEVDAWMATATVTDNCDATVTVSGSYTPPTGNCNQTVTVTFTATDVCGNTATETATFTVNDNIAPVITVPTTPLVQTCFDAAEVDAWMATATVTDNCDATVTVSGSYTPPTGNCNQTVTVTFTATDVCGNTATETATFTVNDNIAPVITVPTTPLVQTCFDAAEVDAWMATATVTDNCDATVTVSGSYTPPTGNCNQTVTVTFTATDVCGNTATETATFTVNDNIAPVITVPTTPLVQTCFDAAEVDAWMATATVTDNCDATVTVSGSYTPPTGNCNQTVTVTFTATDVCGNTATETATFTVNDNIAPVITVPTTPLVQTCFDAAEVDAWMATATVTDNCDATVTVSGSYTPPTGNCNQTVTVTFTATDVCGNTATETATFTVNDNIAPVITVPTTPLVQTCFDAAEVDAWMATATVTDNCDATVTVSGSYTPPTGNCNQTVTVTFTATDVCGNTATETATFTVNDNIAPVITVPTTPLVQTCFDAAEVDAWMATATVTDNCDATVTVSGSYTPPTGNCNQTVTVTFTATDVCGNTATETATFTVNDNIAPVITVPTTPLVQTCFDAAEVDAWMATATVTDNCDATVTVSGSYTPPTGNCNQTVTVTFTATDVCGNTATETATFTVNDNIAPVITVPTTPLVQTCFDAAEVDAWMATATVTDNCDATVTVSGSYTPPTGNCNQTVTVTFTATDVCGNTATETATFTVNDNIAPVITVPTTPLVQTCFDAAEVDAWMATATVTDNCDATVTVSGSYTPPTGNCNQTVTVTFTATDVCGNTATETATFTVNDNIAPVITVPTTPLVQTCFDAAEVDAWMATATVTDNCDATVTVSGSYTPPTGNCNQTVTVTFSATDVCGNTATETATFTVNDNIAPVITVPTTPLVQTCFDAAEVDAWMATATVTDNCDATVTVSGSYTPPTGNCNQTVTVTFSATDVCGNTATETATFTVNDNIAPVITVPTTPLVQTCFDAAEVDAWMATATVTDNCDATVTVSGSYTPPTGNCNQTVTVTFSATDVCGNTATETATFTVNDNIAPVITVPTTPLVQTCFDAAEVDAWMATATVTDNCDATVTVSGSYTPPTGNCNQTVTVTFTATDVCGNTATETATFTVNDNIAPVITVPTTPLVQTCFDAAEVDAWMATATVTDNCDATVTVSGSYTPPTGNCNQTVTVTFTATDVCGNTATETATFTVNDNIAPVITVPTTPLVQTCFDAAEVDAWMATATVTDNCDATVTVSGSYTPPTGNCNQTVTVTFTATDVCGNTATETATFTVNDNIAPVITVPTTPLVQTCFDAAEVDAWMATATVTDNCDATVTVSGSYTPPTGNCNQTVTVTFTATDVCGNTATETATFTVNDNIAPVITVPTTPLVQTCFDAAEVDAWMATATVTDNCDATVTVSGSYTPPTGNCNQTVTVTFSATDVCGNTATETATFTVNDNIAPVITVPTTPLVQTCFDAAEVDAWMATATVTDNCDATVTVSGSYTPPTGNCNQTVTVTFSATDVCGNTATETATFTVNDNIAPVITVPTTPLVQTCFDAAEVDAWMATATVTDNCDATVTVSGSYTPPTGNCNQTVTVTFSATDVCGNTATETATFTVNDNIAPVITVPTTPLVQTCFDAAEVDAWMATATVTDNCDATVTVSGSYTPPTGNCNQTVTVTFSATDVCGNTATETATFTVNDNIAPVITVPTTPLVQTCFDAAEVDAWMATATVTDNCDATVTVSGSYTPPTGNCNQTVTVTFSATDVCGNTATETATFTVNDNIAPVITVPTTPLVQTCFDAAEVDAWMATATVTDNCDATVTVSGSYTPPTGNCNQTVTVTFTATDVCGNTATETATFTVNDNIAPVITVPTTPLVQTCFDAAEVDAWMATATVTDNCDATVTVSGSYTPPTGNCNQTVTVTFTATDVCGNTATETATFTVNDNIAPVITVPTTPLVQTCFDAAEVDAWMATATVTDNCDATVTVSGSYTPPTGNCNQTVTVTFTATDVCGNTATETATFTVNDNIAPVITVPTTPLVQTCFDAAEVDAWMATATVTDNCDATVTVSGSYTPPTGNCNQTVTVTFTATDVCGNTATETATFTVNDNIAPVITVPTTPLVQTCFDAAEVDAWMATATVTDNCDATVTVSGSYTPPTGNCNQTVTVTFSATDVCGNTATETATFTVNDNIAPVITVPTTPLVQTCFDAAEVDAWMATATVTDNCDATVTVSGSYTPPTGNCNQTVTVTFTATDVCGNTATETATFTVNDNIAPVITVPTTPLVQTCFDAAEVDAWMATATVTDNCDATVTVSGSYTPPTGNCNQTVTVTFTATDVCGNTATETATFTVNDNIAPVITVPTTPLVQTCFDAAEVDAWMATATVTDNCDATVTVSGSYTPPTGNCNQTVTVTFTATDVCGNTATETATFTVNDNIAPVITVPTTPLVQTCFDAAEVDAWMATATVTDNCDATVTVSGSYTPPTGNCNQTVTVTFTATDVCGNTATETATFTVNDNIAPVITVPTTPLVQTCFDAAEVDAWMATATVTDNCDATVTVSGSYTPPTGNCNQTVTVTFTATDVCGNTATETATFTVNDNIAPVITVPTTPLVQTCFDAAEVDAWMATATVTDNCDATVTVSGSYTPPTGNCNQTVTVTFTATDVCGNTATETATFTVNDNIAPVITVPTTPLVQTCFDAAEVDAWMATATVTDNCDATVTVSGSYTPPTGNCNQTVTVTFTATDVCGNTATETATFTVNDNIAPVITVPTTPLVQTCFDAAEVDAWMATATVTDNCDATVTVSGSYTPPTGNCNQTVTVTFTATDVCGNTATETATFTVNDNIAPVITVPTTPLVQTCFDAAEVDAWMATATVTDNCDATVTVSGSYTPPTGNCNQTVTVTFTATDVCGNTATETATFTVNDNIAPVITVPTTPLVQTCFDAAEVDAWMATATVTDNCDATVTVSGSYTPPTGNCNQTVTVTFTATDVCGNTATETATFTVNDNIAPVITVPTTPLVQTCFDAAEVDAWMATATVTDNCDATVTVSGSYTPPTGNCNQTVTVTFTATDVCGNTATETATFTVNDNIAPVITVPTTPLVQTCFDAAEVDAWMATATVTDNCDATVTVSGSYTPPTGNCNQTVTVTFTATDVCGNTATETATFTVNDNIAPVITVPTTPLVQTCFDAAEVDAWMATATVTDNCDATVTVSGSYTPPTGNCNQTVTVTFTATDVCGNTATETATFTVNDNIAPVITVPTTPLVQTCFDAAEVDAWMATATVTDNCDATVTVSGSYTPPTGNCNQTVTVTFTATDVCGNTATETATFTVNDNIAPVITVPTTPLVQTCFDAAEVDAWMATATVTDNCDATVTVSGSYTPPTGNCNQTVTVTFTATDVCGNTATETATFTVNDNIAPVITVPTTPLVQTCFDAAEVDAWMATATVTDNCDATVTVSGSYTPPTGNCNQTVTVTFTATDVCGNTATETATFTVNDNIAPVITVPTTPLVQTCFDAAEVDAWMATATVTDNCDATVTVSGSYTPPTGNCNQTVTVTFSATDVCGNTATETATFTVNDNIAPVITVPTTPLVQTCFDAAEVDAWMATATVTDNCDATVTVSGSYTPPTGNCNQTVTVTFTATDVCGNTATETATFTVNDNIAPVITVPTTPLVQTCFDAAEVDAWMATATVTDNCDATVTVSGSYTPPTGNCNQTVTVTFTATDVCGNTATETATFTVNDNIAPVITVPTTPLVQTCFDAAEVDAWMATATVTDNCDATVTVSGSYTPPTGNCNQTVTVTFTATDVCGNTATETATFTVNDNIAPVITVPTTPLVQTCFDAAEVDAWMATATVTDNCDATVTVSGSYTPPTGNCNQTVTVTFTATDVCGNTATETATFTVNDNIAPVITVPTTPLVQTCFDAAEVDAWMATATVTDNCDATVTVSGSYTPPTGNCNQTVTVTFTATDVCGNTATETATFTVNDNIAPVITVPTTPLVQTCFDAAEVDAWMATATVTDNCDATVTVSGSYTPPTGNCNQTVTVTFTATDVCGNTATETATFTVNDNIAPVITVPTTPLVQTCFDAAEVDAWMATATVTDNCDATVTVSGSYTPPTGNCNQTVTVTFSATDVCGNTATETATFTVNDNIAPVITVPTTPLVQTCFDAAEVDAWMATATVTDNCDATVTVSGSYTPPTGNCNQTVTVTFTATDVCGNTATETATFTVNDNIAPVITVPTTPLVQTCFDAAEVDAWMATATVTDNCDATVTVSGSYTPPTGNCNQTVTVTFTATDVCGNTATETATFTVNDNIAPVITVPTTPLVQTCFDAAEVDAWMATATVTDNCDATVTVSGSYTPPTGNCNQTVTVTFTATDVCGNTATETATFTVNDNIAPVITVPTTPLVQTCFDAAEVDAWMATATVTDNCDATVTVSGSYTPPTGNCNQTVTVTFTATDVCGNTATETATFTVNDNIAPVITVPTTPLVQTCFDAAEVDAWMATATVTDNCDATVTVSGSYTPPTGNCNQTVTVTFTATDVCGNTTTETATFTVNDNIAPVITVPTTPLVQTCFDAAEVDAWMATATVTDNCDATVTVSGSYTPPTGNCNQTVTVTFSATDVCGNTATETATFTVNDNIAPVITVPTTPLVQTCFDAAEVDAWMATATVTDNCDATVTVSGSYTPPTGNCNQTVTVTFTATDVCGNTATETVTFTVNDNIAPTISGTIPDQPATLDYPCVYKIPDLTALVRAISDDNCTSISNLTISHATGQEAGTVIAETTTVVVTVADDCDNQTSTSVIVIVPDPITFTVIPDSTICAGASVDLSGLVSDLNGATIKFYDAPQGEGNEVPSVVTPLVTTTYYALATNEDGCSLEQEILITVNPIPTVDPVPDQTAFKGESTVDIIFTGDVSGSVYHWEHDNPEIGLTNLSGEGNILSFIAQNPEDVPIYSNFKAYPVAAGCVGDTIYFIITVNPTPAMPPIEDQIYCVGETASIPEFTCNIPNATFLWQQTNSGYIGLDDPSGEGNFPTFTTVNDGDTPLTATYEVIAKIDDTHQSVPVTFSITVLPTAHINPVPDTIYCSKTTVDEYIFTGNVADAVYTWGKIDGLIIGDLPDEGSGSIPGFSTEPNTTSDLITATYYVKAAYTYDDITCAGDSITFTISIVPIPTVTNIDSFSYCNNTTVPEFIFEGIGTEWQWEQTGGADIGMPIAMGKDTMPEFQAVNLESEPITAYYEVKPIFTAEGSFCGEETFAFSITITPNMVVDTIVAEAIYCDSTKVAEYVFTGNVENDVEYHWEKVSGDDIGLILEQGIDTIPEFTTINMTTEVLSAIYRVTPVYNTSELICNGDTTEFTITVLPKPQVDSVENISVCTNTEISGIVFSGNTDPENTIYRWEHIGGSDIGVPATFGENYMPDFTGTNETNIPLTAFYIVVPVYYYKEIPCEGPPKYFNITVTPEPTLNSPTDGGIVCPGTNFIYTATSDAEGVDFYWTRPAIAGINDSTSGQGIGPNITELLTNNTTDTIRVTYYLSVGYTTCMNDSIAITALVYPAPEILLKTTPAETCANVEILSIPYETVQENIPMLYQITYSEAARSKGFIDMPGFVPLPQDTFTIFIPEGVPNDIYRATISIKNDTCSQITNYPFSFTILQDTKITEQPPATIKTCVGNQLILSVSAEGANLTYQWYKNGDSIPNATDSYLNLSPVVASDTGAYYVAIEGACGFLNSEITLVEPNDINIDSIALENNNVELYVVADTGKYIAYQWYRLDHFGNLQMIYGATQQQYIASMGLEGTYFVEVTYANDSTAMSCPFVVEKKTVIENDIIIYPNPVMQDGTISVTINISTDELYGSFIDIYNMLGQQVLHQQVTEKITKLQMSVAAGSYIIMVNSSLGRIVTEKIIVY